jgi:phage tail sheath protein FI
VSEGKVIIDIGFSPNIPAEFITFTLQQPVGQQTETI